MLKRTFSMVLIMQIATFTIASAQQNQAVEFYEPSAESEWTPRSFVDRHEGPVTLLANNKDSCTGNIISGQWILTAKHCTKVLHDTDQGTVGPAFGLGEEVTFSYQCRNPEDDLATCKEANFHSPDAPPFAEQPKINLIIPPKNSDDKSLDYILGYIEASDSIQRKYGVNPIAAIDLKIGERITEISHAFKKPKKIEAGKFTGIYNGDKPKDFGKFIVEDLSTGQGASGSGWLEDTGYLVAIITTRESPTIHYGVPVKRMWQDNINIRKLAAVWQISNFGVRSLAATENGTLYAVASEPSLFVLEHLPNNTSEFPWNIISGFEVSEIFAGGDKLYAVDLFNDHIYVYQGSNNWHNIGRATGPIAVSYNGKLYMVSENKNIIYQWDGAWRSIANRVFATDIIAGKNTFYYRDDFSGTLHRWEGEFNTFKTVSRDHKGIDFATSRNSGKLYRLLENGMIESQSGLDDSWNKTGEGAKRLFPGRSNVYFQSQHNNEVYEYLRRGVWDKLTRPTNLFVAANDMIAAKDKKTSKMHRYRLDTSTPPMQATLVEGIKQHDRLYPFEERHYVFNVDNDIDQLRVILNISDNSDFDVYGRKDARPNKRHWDFRGYTGGGEDFTVDNISAGQWHIMVKHYSGSQSGFNLLLSKRYKRPNPPRPCGDCEHIYGEMWYSGDQDILPYRPNGNYYWAPAGIHRAWLSGQSGTDFDIKLEYWTSNGWDFAYQSISADSEEEITYQGKQGYYRWKIRSYQGEGDYDFWFTNSVLPTD